METGTERERTSTLQTALEGTRFANVRWIAETGSTNADLLVQAASGSGEQALIADLQTAGRGRRNRVWQAPPGSSLMVSLLVHHADPAQAFWHVGALALAGAEAASRATGAAVKLKWPNDLLIDDKKLAGILAQQSGDALVMGMGMNVNWQADMPAEFADRATSLDRHVAADEQGPTGLPIDRVALAIDVLTRVGYWLDQPVRQVRAAWIDRCASLQRSVRIELEQGHEEGRAVDVDASGALVVDQDGERVMFHVGDVVHLRPNNGRLTG